MPKQTGPRESGKTVLRGLHARGGEACRPTVSPWRFVAKSVSWVLVDVSQSSPSDHKNTVRTRQQVQRAEPAAAWLGHQISPGSPTSTVGKAES